MYRVVSVLVSYNTQRIVSRDDVAFNKDGPEYMRYRSVEVTVSMNAHTCMFVFAICVCYLIIVRSV